MSSMLRALSVIAAIAAASPAVADACFDKVEACEKNVNDKFGACIDPCFANVNPEDGGAGTEQCRKPCSDASDKGYEVCRKISAKCLESMD